MSDYYVYILASTSRTLYVRMTNDLLRRMYEHKHHLVPGFTSRYRIHRLAYFEQAQDARAAITREKADQGLAEGQEGRFDPFHEPDLERSA